MRSAGIEAIMRLNQVTVACSDVPRTIVFYRQLGLRLIVENDHYARFELEDGGATFSVERLGEVAPSLTCVYFELPSAAALDARVGELSTTGLAFEHGPIDQPWLWREARLRDPDGNLICLYVAGENRRHPPWRITTGG